MKSHTQSNLLIKIGALFLASWATPLSAETVDCTAITSLPTTIGTQGIYCLTQDVSTSISSGNAITINVNNVTIDLNGWKMGGLAAGTATTARGISAVNKKNITIKNGTIRGFKTGVYVTGDGAIIKNIRADGNTNTGIFTVSGGALIKNNQVVNTGGSTELADVTVTGIYGGGFGTKITNNQISTLSPTGSGNAYGIRLSAAAICLIGQPCANADSSQVNANLVSGTKPGGGGTSYGIYIVGQSFSTFTNTANNVGATSNVISNMHVCIYYHPTLASGIYARNTAMGCDSAFVSGTAGPGNSSN